MSMPLHRVTVATLLCIACIVPLCIHRSDAEAVWPESSTQWLSADPDRCTAIIVGRKAGASGPMTTHTADCSDCDFRINKVPAKDWPAGSKRPLYIYKGNYPSLITTTRGATWLPNNLEGTPDQIKAWGTESIITGYIPQVAHTYALFEAGYGIMNEYQVSIGESTCASRFWAAPVTAGGKAMIEIRSMSQIALERAKTAREAVQIMGDLATTYGFYAADWSGGDASKGEGGEALTVIDKTEAWVFHCLSDDTGTSAVWAAQRLQEDHRLLEFPRETRGSCPDLLDDTPMIILPSEQYFAIPSTVATATTSCSSYVLQYSSVSVAAVANQFIIRGVKVGSDDFMYSASMFSVATRQNVLTLVDGHLDFLKTFSPQRAHSAYATRRVWRVFNLVAPSIVLPPFTDSYGSDYPFSVKADRVLAATDLMQVQRDHYEGTQFDLTKGLAAGPYGDPNRFDMGAQPADNLTMIDILKGSYERSISMFRTSYSFVAQARADRPDLLALLWFSQYAPSSSSYAPLYLSSSITPLSYTRGTLFKYDSTVAFWNFCAAGNYAGRFYKHAMADVTSLIQSLQQSSVAAVDQVEQKVMYLYRAQNYSSVDYSTAPIIAMTTALSNEQALSIIVAWRDLLPTLITKYHDGYVATDLTAASIHMVRLFYPKAWLEATGYFSTSVNKGPDVIMFSSDTTTYAALTPLNVMLIVLFTAVVSIFTGVIIGSKAYGRSHQYYSIV